jgi:glucarate dehydratase
MTVQALRISRVTATPVAVPIIAPRRHSDGVTAWTVRTILQVEAENGLVGVGEVGPRATQDRLRSVCARLVGEDAFALERVRLRFGAGKFYSQEAASLVAAIEMACLDLQGKTLGRPVSDLLGGRVREIIPLIAYIFRLDATHARPAVATTDEVVAHARQVVDQFGFETIKFKGGAVSPWEDVETMHALRAAFPRAELRLDPNGVWSVETSLRVADALRGCSLEWLEDPTLGIEHMAEVTRRGGIPTATNMCVTHPEEFPRAVAVRAVDIVLCDLWYWGGMRASGYLAAMCDTFGFGLGIHSGGGSSELGPGMSAMLQLAATFPNLVHAADAMYHHQVDDVIIGGLLPIHNGHMTVPSGPGLGVELDPERLGRYSELFRETAVERASRPPDPSRPGWYPTYPAW